LSANTILEGGKSYVIKLLAYFLLEQPWCRSPHLARTIKLRTTFLYADVLTLTGGANLKRPLADALRLC
jgi:hypothetical protein